MYHDTISYMHVIYKQSVGGYYFEILIDEILLSFLLLTAL